MATHTEEKMEEKTAIDTIVKKPVSRRGFMKATAAIGGGAAALSLLPDPEKKGEGAAKAAETTDFVNGSWIPSGCNMCGGQCGIQVYVEEGVARKIEPLKYPSNIANINVPGTAEAYFDGALAAGDLGRLCCKGNSGFHSLYDPDRLKSPMVRVGPKGSGQFEPVSWEDAIFLTAQKLTEIRNAYGARSLVWFGEDHSFTHPQQDFCDAFGTPNYSNHSNICDVSRKALYKSTIGHDRPLPDMEGTDFLLVFGWNFLSALKWIHLAAIFIRGAVKPGFKFVYVDPVFNETAAKADQWVPIRPATDGALALALCKLVIDSGEYDAGFVANWTFGFAEFEAYLNGTGSYAGVGPWTEAPYNGDITAWASAETGIDQATITGLAADLTAAYSAGKKICIDIWSGPGHHSNATQGGRAVACLNLLFGTVDKSGTMVFPLRDGPGRRPANAAWPSKDGWRADGRDDVTIKEDVLSDRDLTLGEDCKKKDGTILFAKGTLFPAGTIIPGASGTVDDTDGNKLLGLKFHKKYSYSHGSGIYVEMIQRMVEQKDFLGIDYPIKACVVVFQNLVMNTPNTARNIKALEAMDFVVVVDTHLSETAHYADVIFPGTNYLERFDFNAAWITYRTVGLRQPVVKSWIGGRSESQLLLDLGAAMGFKGFKDAPANETDEAYLEEEWERFMASGSPSKSAWQNQMTWEQLKAQGYWMETGAWGGTQYSKHEGNYGKTFDPAKMDIKSYTAGSQTIYTVREQDSKDPTKMNAVGVSPASTLASGATFMKGFGTTTRFGQFFDPTMNDYYTGKKYPAGQSMKEDPRYYPLPYYLPPDDAPGGAYPLYFISWKEVEHTHTRTLNNGWLMQMRGENKLLIHPDTAAQYGIVDNDWVWVETPVNRIKVRAFVTGGIHGECVGFFRGFGHWALGEIAKGKGAHDNWVLPGKAEIHSGQAVHKEVGCQIYKAAL